MVTVLNISCWQGQGRIGFVHHPPELVASENGGCDGDDVFLE